MHSPQVRIKKKWSWAFSRSNQECRKGGFQVWIRSQIQTILERHQGFVLALYLEKEATEL